LVHWNTLLVSTYADPDTTPGLRSAVREAAADLHRRVPPVGRTCLPDDAQSGCASASGLVAALAAIDDRSGVRDPLSRLVERLLSPEQNHLGVQSPVLPAGNRGTGLVDESE
jgi:hypothetical protein